MIRKIILLAILLPFLITKNFAVLPTPQLTSPGDASVGNPANTIINWYNVTGATTYELRIDTDSAFTSTVIQSVVSSQFATAQLFYGSTYYWRVRALKTSGIADSSDWTQTFSFTTADTLTITAPLNAAINQFPKTYLNWSNNGGSTNYQVQFDVEITFGSIALLDTILTDSISALYATNLNFGTRYYWRARAMHALDTMAWTSAFSFTTLDSVTLSAPSNGASFLSTNVELDWDYISGITAYQVELDKVPSFNSAAFQTSILPDSTSHWIASNLAFGATYYWRVRAWHTNDTTQWSQTWQFSTLVSLTLTSPVDFSINQYPNVTLNWNYITSPVWYDTEYDTSASFNTSQYNYSSNDTISEMNTSNLLFGTTYFWRARAHNAADTSQWSSTWSFTTIDTITKSYPLNEAATVATQVTLDWDAVEGTNGYDVRVDTLPNYTSAFAIYLSPANSSQQLFNLYFGKKYYWAVRAFHDADTMVWTSNWAFTTADSVSLTSPSNNSVDAFPRTNLNWSTLNGSTGYLVQYDTTSNFSSSVLKSDTTSQSNYFTANLFFNQNYYWRVKAINLVDTSAWSEVWNFKTINQLTHTSPIDGAVGEALLTEINWSGISGAIGYIYRYDSSPLFNINPLTGNSIGTNSRADITLPLYGETYYWQVAAIDSADTSAWSNPWSFTTLYQNINAPVLVSPADVSGGLPTVNVVLTWNPEPAIALYEYSYSVSPAFSNAFTAGTLDTFAVIGGLSSFTTYYWRVRAVNANGYSPWSTVFSFTTLNTFTAAPILSSPEDAAIDVPQPVTFIWFPLNFASSYACEYSLDSLFTAPILLNSTDTFAVSLVLDPLTTYYWRVKGVDGNATSTWSEVWNFTTENPLSSAPILYAPSDASIGVSLPANFSWYPVTLASSYECEYDTDSLFSAPTTLLANDTSVISLPITPLTIYFWRVRAVLGNVSSPWSTVWNFTTANPLTSAPVQYSPSDLSSIMNNPVTFVWFMQDGAAFYECEYDTDSLFSSPINLLVTDTEAVSQVLNSGTTYFWRIRGAYNSLYSPWSAVWRFTSNGIMAPTQTMPVNGDTLPFNLVQFFWDTLAFADGYECQYDTSSAFTNPVVLNTTVASTSNQIVLPLKTYYWRVRATLGTQFSPWSSIWSVFTGFPVGVSSIEANQNLTLYPNPACETVSIKFENHSTKAITASIFSAKGNAVWVKNSTGTINETIDLSAFARGNYVVKIQNGQNVVVKKLVVK